MGFAIGDRVLATGSHGWRREGVKGLYGHIAAVAPFPDSGHTTYEESMYVVEAHGYVMRDGTVLAFERSDYLVTVRESELEHDD